MTEQISLDEKPAIEDDSSANTSQEVNENGTDPMRQLISPP